MNGSPVFPPLAFIPRSWSHDPCIEGFPGIPRESHARVCHPIKNLKVGSVTIPEWNRKWMSLLSFTLGLFYLSPPLPSVYPLSPIPSFASLAHCPCSPCVSYFFVHQVSLHFFTNLQYQWHYNHAIIIHYLSLYKAMTKVFLWCVIVAAADTYLALLKKGEEPDLLQLYLPFSYSSNRLWFYLVKWCDSSWHQYAPIVRQHPLTSIASTVAAENLNF